MNANVAFFGVDPDSIRGRRSRRQHVDVTLPPQRDPITHFAVLAPKDFTLNAVESPRNSAWLLAAMGVRRGLTFPEQQRTRE